MDTQNLRIVTFPHDMLRRRTRRIDSIDDEVRAVAARMIELMQEAEGVGLAAPQVALPWRMFVTAANEEANEPQRVFINPVISGATEETDVREEGCLSIPNVHVDVRRPRGITITALDLDGRTFSLTRDDLIARVWQHEVDHLDGVLIIDRMSPMDRIANRRAIRDLKAAAK